MLTRVLDLAVLLLVAVAVLLPRPDVKVQPGLRLDDERRLRVAELEAELLARPGDPAASLELADLFMDARRPDWAAAVLGGSLRRTPDDHRLYARQALALADHFAAGPAFDAANRAHGLCEGGSRVPCTEGEKTRIRFLRDTLEQVQNIDMRKDPNAAKERLLKALHPVYVPGKKPAKPAASTPAPAPQ